MAAARPCSLRHLFPYLPQQPGCNKRLRAAASLIMDCIRVLAADGLLAARPGQVLIGDKNYYGRGFEAAIAEEGIRLLRPARKGEPPRAGAQYFKPLRQVSDTFKRQLNLERHGGHTPGGVIVRVCSDPRPHRRHLAQRHHRPANPAITHGLQPLTPWN